MSTRRALGITALALGAAAPFVQPPASAPRTIDIDALAALVAREEDHVDALELAAWIRARRPGLRVIDVREPGDDDGESIPHAEHHPIRALTQLRFGADEVLVLYSRSGAHAAQAWVFLRAMGARRVYFLRGGVQAWQEDVLRPMLAADADAATRKAFEARAALSRYFGGVPVLGAGGEHSGDAGSDHARPTHRRRTGC